MLAIALLTERLAYEWDDLREPFPTIHLYQNLTADIPLDELSGTINGHGFAIDLSAVQYLAETCRSCTLWDLTITGHFTSVFAVAYDATFESVSLVNAASSGSLVYYSYGTLRYNNLLVLDSSIRGFVRRSYYSVILENALLVDSTFGFFELAAPSLTFSNGRVSNCSLTDVTSGLESLVYIYNSRFQFNEIPDSSQTFYYSSIISNKSSFYFPKNSCLIFRSQNCSNCSNCSTYTGEYFGPQDDEIYPPGKASELLKELYATARAKTPLDGLCKGCLNCGPGSGYSKDGYYIYNISTLDDIICESCAEGKVYALPVEAAPASPAGFKCYRDGCGGAAACRVTPENLSYGPACPPRHSGENCDTCDPGFVYINNICYKAIKGGNECFASPAGVGCVACGGGYRLAGGAGGLYYCVWRPESAVYVLGAVFGVLAAVFVAAAVLCALAARGAAPPRYLQSKQLAGV